MSSHKRADSTDSANQSVKGQANRLQKLRIRQHPLERLAPMWLRMLQMQPHEDHFTSLVAETWRKAPALSLSAIGWGR